MSEEFRREVRFEPGYYGLEIRWLLHGPKASMQFLLMTHWLPTWDSEPLAKVCAPLPADLGYHADAPQYGGQGELTCEFRPSGRCFYEGSSSAADAVFSLLLRHGEEAVWALLRKKYDELEMEAR